MWKMTTRSGCLAEAEEGGRRTYRGGGIGAALRRWRAKDCKPSGGEARRRPDRTASVERKRQKIRSKEKEACVHYQMTTEQQGEDNAAAELSRQQVIAGKIAQQLERQRGRRATAACAWLRGRPSWATSCPPPRAAASTGSSGQKESKRRENEREGDADSNIRDGRRRETAETREKRGITETPTQ